MNLYKKATDCPTAITIQLLEVKHNQSMFDTSPTVFYSYTGTMLLLYGTTWHYVGNGSCPPPSLHPLNQTQTFA